MKKYCVLCLLFFITPEIFAESTPLSNLSQEIFNHVKLIEKMQENSCGICREKLLKTALDGLDSIFSPGRLFHGDSGLIFIKNTAFSDHSLVLFSDPLPLKKKRTDLKDMPQQIAISFKFHTKKKHLIGIQAVDFTSKEIASIRSNGKEGDRFRGRIQVISFDYGDRRSLTYYPSMATLEIHCRVLILENIH